VAVICQSQFAVQEHFKFLIPRTEEVRPAKCKAIPYKLHDDTEKKSTPQPSRDPRWLQRIAPRSLLEARPRWKDAISCLKHVKQPLTACAMNRSAATEHLSHR